MRAMEGVNHNKRQRGYGARDKEKIINAIKKLHINGYSQVDIANLLNIHRGTIKRWNNELHFIESRTPGEQNKFSFIINSTIMCNDLINLGITPQKTGK